MAWNNCKVICEMPILFSNWVLCDEGFEMIVISEIPNSKLKLEICISAARGFTASAKKMRRSSLAFNILPKLTFSVKVGSYWLIACYPSFWNLFELVINHFLMSHISLNLLRKFSWTMENCLHDGADSILWMRLSGIWRQSLSS